LASFLEKDRLPENLNMASTVAEMTRSELKKMMEAVIERKLVELLGDPDDGLLLRRSVRARLLRQKRAVSGGERGKSLDEVAGRLGLE
jgi:hypothetical protein